MTILKAPISLHGVYAVWRRHIDVYLDSWFLNFSAPIYEPIIYLLGLGLGLAPLIGKIQYHGISIDYVSFILPGMMVHGCVQQSLAGSAHETFLSLHYSKLWHSRMTSSLSFEDILLGDLIWSATKGIIAANLVGLVGFLWGILPLLTWGLLQPALLLGALLMASIGLIVAGLAGSVQSLSYITYFLLLPMNFLCGTLFPRSQFPTWLEAVATILPVSPLIDLLRSYISVEYPVYKGVWLVFLTATCFLWGHQVVYKRLFGLFEKPARL